MFIFRKKKQKLILKQYQIFREDGLELKLRANSFRIFDNKILKEKNDITVNTDAYFYLNGELSAVVRDIDQVYEIIENEKVEKY